ncbi:MAG TPA: hypothetical protein VN673_14780, partial [Clostridia bacterium]|nr:hypothetical protein [Clostridia bacterium]
ANTANLVATLQPTGGITPVGAAQKSYGQLVFGGGSTANSFTFLANGGNGEAVTATLKLQDGAVNLGTVSFVFNLPAGNGFSNTTAITVADHGAAFPYPSTIEVAGLAGNVSKVAVLLFNVSHSFPRDLNLMLVAPDGAKALLMAHAGGAHALTNVSFGLDEGAAAVLPGTNAIVADRYKPAAYGNAPAFPQPAPASPYPAALTALNGSTPNGTWSLYVMDDSIGDSGVIAGGWGLEIVTVEPVSPVTDLAVAMGAAPAGFYLGATFTNVVAITNYGATIAGGVFLTNSFPESIQLVSLSGSQGEVLTTNAGSAVWSIGGLDSGSVASVQLVLKPTLAGSFTVSAVAGSGAVDLNQANNVGESVLNVLEAAPAVIEGSMVGGEFRLTMTAEPNLTYLIQASPDLVTWTTLDIVVASPGGTIKYADTNTPSFSSRYYRAVRVLP